MSNKISKLKAELANAIDMASYHEEQAKMCQAKANALQGHIDIEEELGNLCNGPSFDYSDHGFGKHNHGPSFGKHIQGCPRCDELKNGAEPAEGRCGVSRGW